MPPATRVAVEYKFNDEVLVSSRPLPYERAEDSLPDVAQMITRISNALVNSIGAEGLLRIIAKGKDVDVSELILPLLPAIQIAADQLGNGMLKKLAPLLLFSTTATIPDEKGVKQVCDLSKMADRATLFDAYPAAYLPTLFHAGRVTYARFFPVKGLLGSTDQTAEG